MESILPGWVMYVLVGGIAAAVGSFVTMALTRFRTGMSWGGRSQCMTCRAVLGWRDLFPVASCLVSRARCRHCGAGYGWWHFWVEVATVTSVVLVWHTYGFGLEFFILGLSAVLLVFASAYDLRHMIIPDTVVGILFVLAVVGVLADVLAGSFVLESFARSHLIGLVALPLPFLIIWVVSRGQWMGMGDIKLMAWMGFSLGLVAGIDALILSFWIGGLVGLGILLLRALSRAGFGFSSKMKEMIFAPQIPFGPFLAVGWLLVVLGVGIVGILV